MYLYKSYNCLFIGKTIEIKHSKDLSEDNVVSQDFIHPNVAAIHATPDPLKMSQRSTKSNRQHVA